MASTANVKDTEIAWVDLCDYVGAPDERNANVLDA